MPREASAADAHSTVKDQIVEMYEDFEHEVEHEVHNPPDSSQSDMLVGKHINGLVITFFILIVLALLAVIVGGRSIPTIRAIRIQAFAHPEETR